MVTVLVLGGTSEARALAARLVSQPGLRVISSLAGRVRNPVLPAGEVRIGGFGGVTGLADWARAEGVDAVVDATHPFAETISAHAVAACTQTGLPLLRLARPAWRAQPGDDWHQAGSLAEAAAILPSLGQRVFLTTGRQGLSAFAAPTLAPPTLAAPTLAELSRLWFLIRCVDAPSGALPANREVLLARGPYDRAAERTLMRRFAIDVLVTKNSGGSLTEGKLAAARDLGIPVVIVRRPAPAPTYVHDTTGVHKTTSVAAAASVDDAVSWVLDCAGEPGARTRDGRAPDRSAGA